MASCQAFARDTGRKLHLEVEPGTFMVANCGVSINISNKHVPIRLMHCTKAARLCGCSSTKPATNFNSSSGRQVDCIG